MSFLDNAEALKRTKTALIPFEKLISLRANEIAESLRGIRDLALIVSKYAFEMPPLRFSNVATEFPKLTKAGALYADSVKYEDIPMRACNGRPRAEGRMLVYVNMEARMKLGLCAGGFRICRVPSKDSRMNSGEHIGNNHTMMPSAVVLVSTAISGHNKYHIILGRSKKSTINYEQLLTIPEFDRGEVVLFCGCVNTNSHPREHASHHFDIPCDKCGFALVYDLEAKKWLPSFP
jgi:hypothetical protein